jgi:hypothetical protein
MAAFKLSGSGKKLGGCIRSLGATNATFVSRLDSFSEVMPSGQNMKYCSPNRLEILRVLTDAYT